MGLLLPPGSGDMPDDLQRLLQEGSPLHGWTGDPNMWLQACDGKRCGKRACGGNGWLVMQSLRSGRTKAIMHNPSSRIDASFLRKLAEGDVRARGTDVIMAEIDKHNEAVEREAARIAAEKFEEGAQRLAFEMRKM